MVLDFSENGQFSIWDELNMKWQGKYTFPLIYLKSQYLLMDVSSKYACCVVYH